MPIYEYKCDKCQHQFELIQKVDAATKTICSKCSGQASRIVSSTSFQLKGTGWYATDFKSPQTATKQPTTASDAKKTD